MEAEAAGPARQRKRECYWGEECHLCGDTAGGAQGWEWEWTAGRGEDAGGKRGEQKAESGIGELTRLDEFNCFFFFGRKSRG